MSNGFFALAWRRVPILALGALVAGGCFSRDPIRLDSPDPGSKIPAIRQAVRQEDRRAVSQLVGDLESDDPAVRFYAARALHELTGESFGYSYYADESRREAAVEKWQEWLNNQRPQNAAGARPPQQVGG